MTEVRAGGKVSVPVLANDYDPEGGALEVVDVTPWAGVDVSPGLNGQTVDVRVGTGVMSGFTLGYTVADVAGNRSSAFIEVQIVPADEVNRPPIARTDIARTTSGSAIVIAAVANDSDPDGDIIAVASLRSQPAGGVAAIEGSEIRYTPRATFSGTDRLTYSLVDAGGELAIGEVLIGVQPLPPENRAPEAFDDRYQAIAGSAPLVLDVRANDSDPDGDTVRVTTVSAPGAGEAKVPDDGSGVVFTLPAEVAAPGIELAFTYAIDDGRGGIAQATVTVDVSPVGEAVAPVAVDDLVGPVTPGQSVEIDLLANDLDPDGDPADLMVTSDDPALATREGSVVTVFAGATSGRHTYTITDAAGLNDTAEVDVLVVTNRAPEVRPLAAETAAGTPITFELASQVSDPDGDALYFTCCDNPQGGSATTATNEPGRLSVTFAPDDGFAGPASFAYTVDDQQGHLVAGAVTVDVLAPTNRPPIVTGTIVGVEAGVPTNIDLNALVTDPDPGDVLTFTTSEPAHGAVTLTRDGGFVVASAPIDGAERSDSFDVTVTDAAGLSASATVQLTVTPPEAPPPQARDDEATTNQGQAVTVAVLDNDIDPLGGGLMITDVLPGRGGVQLHGWSGRGVQPGSRLLRHDLGRLRRARPGRTWPRARPRAGSRSPSSAALPRRAHPSPTPATARRRSRGRRRRATGRPSTSSRSASTAVRPAPSVAAPGTRGAGCPTAYPSPSRCAPTTAPTGDRGAVRRPPSRPTSSRAARRHRPCSSPTRP